MKIVKLASATFILLFLALRGIRKILSPPESGKYAFLVCKLVSSVTKSKNFLFFFALNVIILTILLVNGNPSGSDQFDLYACILPPSDFELERHQEEVAGKAIVDEDNYKEEDEDDEFVPRLVHVEYKHEKTLFLEYFNGEDDEDSDGFHGFNGYEEDNDDVGGSDEDTSSDDEEDEDLKRRFDEFIAKNNKQWIEELRSDRLLITSG